MKRHVRIQQPFTTHRFDVRSWAIELPIAASDVVAIICELSLLLFGRSEQLSVLCGNERKLVISLGNRVSQMPQSVEESAAIAFSLSRNDLEVVTCYLLTWYRDGAAETKHIDIPILSNRAAGEDCTLVIHAAISRAPMTGDDAERMLRHLP
jgi:hypothetical protein